MIYTITLNPALDRNLWIEKVVTDDSNRVQKEERYAAGKGILMVSEKEQHFAVPPQVTVVNTIGAGDSAIAGFVYGNVLGKSLQESLVYVLMMTFRILSLRSSYIVTMKLSVT